MHAPIVSYDYDTMPLIIIIIIHVHLRFLSSRSRFWSGPACFSWLLSWKIAWTKWQWRWRISLADTCVCVCARFSEDKVPARWGGDGRRGGGLRCAAPHASHCPLIVILQFTSNIAPMLVVTISTKIEIEIEIEIEIPISGRAVQAEMSSNTFPCSLNQK